MSEASTLASSWADLPWFALLSMAFFYLPGRATLRLVRLGVGGLDEVALALPLGILGSLLSFWLAAALELPAMAYSWPLMGAAGVLLGREAPRFTWPPRPILWWLVAIVSVSFLPFWLIPIYVQNAVPTPDGGLAFYPLGDVVLHLTLAQDLVHGLPDRVPFLPDRAAAYHYGSGFLVAGLARAGGLAVPSVALRCLPMLGAAVATLAVFCAARAFLGSERGGLLAALIVVLGEDFSFVPGLLVGAPQPWSVHFFGTPTMMSLYHLNPMIYGVAFLFAGLLATLRLARSPRIAWAAVAATLFAGASLFKIFTGAHVVASLAIATLLTRGRVRPLTTLTVLTAMLLAPTLVSSGAQSGTFSVRIEPWPYVPAALLRSGLGDVSWGKSALAFYAGSGELAGALSFFMLALPLYLVGAVGVGVLGWVWMAQRNTWQGESWVRLWLVVFACIGPAISLTWAVTPRGYPASQVYNDAVWFFGQSELVLRLLAIAALLPLLEAGARSSRMLTTILVISLSLPSTVEYLAFQVRYGRTTALSSETVSALGWLKRHAAARNVVYAPEPLAMAVASLTPCRSATLQVFPRSLLSPDELRQLLEEGESFWRSWSNGGFEPAPLRRFEADYLLAPLAGRVGAWPRGLELVWTGAQLAIFEVSLVGTGNSSAETTPRSLASQ